MKRPSFTMKTTRRAQHQNLKILKTFLQLVQVDSFQMSGAFLGGVPRISSSQRYSLFVRITLQCLFHPVCEHCTEWECVSLNVPSVIPMLRWGKKCCCIVHLHVKLNINGSSALSDRPCCQAIWRHTVS